MEFHFKISHKVIFYFDFMVPISENHGGLNLSFVVLIISHSALFSLMFVNLQVQDYMYLSLGIPQAQTGFCFCFCFLFFDASTRSQQELSSWDYFSFFQMSFLIQESQVGEVYLELAQSLVSDQLIHRSVYIYPQGNTSSKLLATHTPHPGFSLLFIMDQLKIFLISCNPMMYLKKLTSSRISLFWSHGILYSVQPPILTEVRVLKAASFFFFFK